MGKHKANHNITTDGFYTNQTDSTHKYIIPTPTSADYYIWLIGRIPDESQLDTELTAYKYSTIDTVELPLISNSEPNTIFNVSNLEADLMPTVSIKNKLQIPATATTEDIANTTFGLEMQTGTSGWVSSKTTDYYVSKGATSGTHSGDIEYLSDNSTQVPSIILNLYNSQNISQTTSVGFVAINFDVLQPQTPIRYKITKLRIKISIYTSKEQQAGYAIGIAPGEKI